MKEIALQTRSVHSHRFVIRPGSETGSGPEGPVLRQIHPESLFSEPTVHNPEMSVNKLSNIFRILELGSGWGEFCAEWMKLHPDHQYLALEIKADRIKNLVKKLEQQGTENVRILPVNFNWFLTELFSPASFDLIIVNFPDPWPKKRHWKHRLVQPGFPEKTARLLKPEGRIYLATDYGPYARKMISVFRNSPIFKNEYDWPHYVRSRPEGFPSTKFETIHTSMGKRPYYMSWRLLPDESQNPKI